MDFPAFPMLAKFIQYAPTIRNIIATASTNAEIGDKIMALAPDIAVLLEEIGAALFPQLAPALHLVAGAIATFDPDGVKWLQGALNAMLHLDPPLEVDGIYGPATAEAVKQAQAQLGLDPDGFAGVITRAALETYLRAHPA
jgi:peptidoglycan hydrolase-like protein with peptidoglycan-binding domain